VESVHTIDSGIPFLLQRANSYPRYLKYKETEKYFVKTVMIDIRQSYQYWFEYQDIIFFSIISHSANSNQCPFVNLCPFVILQNTQLQNGILLLLYLL
jgi:hypothetical protein